ncbi:hypothetical protein LCGC14_1566480 [marine sediment metagenome]|uniref:Uncharacterized protein n=1 Tax=marine sediment metagenome TaxID=412755 RepID=A0A0F9IKV8_9ZZZZ
MIEYEAKHELSVSKLVNQFLVHTKIISRQIENSKRFCMLCKQKIFRRN